MKKLLSSIIFFVLAGVNIIFAQNYNLSEISKARLVTEYSADTTVDEMDTVTFGSYPQSDVTGATKEPIEWIVLDRQGDKMLLLSKRILDCKMYNDIAGTYITWENCTLRTFLNTTFLNTAFDSAEKNLIGTTKVVSEDEIFWEYESDDGGKYWISNETYEEEKAWDIENWTQYYSNGVLVTGKDTYDKIFCLSLGEFKNYFKNKNDGWLVDWHSPTAATDGTNYAKAVKNQYKHINIDIKQERESIFGSYYYLNRNYGDKNYSWWLRGLMDFDYAKHIDHDGCYGRMSDNWDYGIGIRPAIWVVTSSLGNSVDTNVTSNVSERISQDISYSVNTGSNNNISVGDNNSIDYKNILLYPDDITEVNLKKYFDEFNIKQNLDAESYDELAWNSMPDNGQGGTTGTWLSFLYFAKEALAGEPQGFVEMGVQYAYGEGVPTNAELAIEYMNKAISLGHYNAYISLGHLYKQGRLGNKDYIKARECYEKAVNLGFEKAQKYIDELNSLDNSITSDTAKNTNQDMSVIESNNSVDLQNNNVSISNEEVYNTTTVRETQQNTQHETEQIIQAEIEKNQSIGSRDFSNLASQLKKARLVSDYSINTTIDEMDTVTFGSYPQFDMSDTKKEPIEWLVVKREGSGVLLLSKYVLDYKQFNEIYKKTDWEKSTLRKWLNEEFLEKAFSDIEKSFIWQKQNNYIARDKDDWPVWGHTNDDYIFLLPVDELKNYFSGSVWNNFWNGRDEKKTEERLATNDTTFARNNKKTWLTNYYQSKNKSFDSNYEKYIKRVEYWGEAMVSSTDAENISDFLGINVTPVDGLYGVRPALWINTWRVNDYVNDSAKVNSTVVKSNDEKINEDFDTNYSVVDASNQNNTIQETKNVSGTINDNNNAQSNVLEENINIDGADAYQNSGELNNTNIITSSNISEYTIYNTNVNDVKVYNSNSGGKVIGILKKDAIVFVKNIIDDDKWAEINFNGITGYVKRVWINKVADNEAEKIKEVYLENKNNINNGTNTNVNASTSGDYEGFVKPEPTDIYYFHKEFDEQNKKKIDPTVYYYAKQDSSNKIITSIEKKDIRDGLFGSGFFARTKKVYHNIEITFDEETQKRLAKYVDFDLHYRWEEGGYEWCLLVGDSMNSLENISGYSLLPRYDVDTNTYMEGASYYQKGKIQLNYSSSYKQDIIYNKLKNAKIIMLTTKNVIKSSEKKIISKELLGGVEKISKVDTGAKKNEPKLNFARAYVDKSTEEAIIEYTKHNRGKYICIIDDFQGIIDYEEEIEEPKDKCSELLIWLYAYDSNAYARYAFEMIKYFKIYGCELDIIYELNTSNGFEDFEKVYKSKGTPYMAKRNEVKVYCTNSEDGKVLDYLYKDRVVFLYEIMGDWAKINCFGYTGYVKLSDIYEVK